MLNDAHIQSYLQEQGLSPDLIAQVTAFRQQYEVGVDTQRLVEQLFGFVPITILQGHISPLQQGFYTRCGGNGRRRRTFLGDDFANAPQQVLNSPHLAHVLGLKPMEPLRHVVGVQIFIAGDERLFCPAAIRDRNRDHSFFTQTALKYS